jgi:subtilase family serine protease
LWIGSTFCGVGYGATADRITSGLSAATVPLAGHIHRLAQPQFDQGRVEPSMPMGTITLAVTPTAAQQQAITQLLADQQNPKSASYHKWLTPEQYADRFGLSKNDIQQIATWLTGQGFTMVHTARGRNWVSFTGTAAQVEAAFGTEIHHYNVNNEMHYANSTAPKIPAGLAGLGAGIRGLNDFRPRVRAKHPNARPDWFSSKSGNFIAPGDMATIYDINALYNAGFDGTGETLAVMGQTDVYLADLNDFRSGFGLSTYTCTTNTSGVITACNDPHFKYILDGQDPSVSTHGDLGEADLDLEWTGAIARGAQIIYVNSTDTFTSYYYAIDNKVAPVISLSYGLCEFDDNNLVNDEVELQTANLEGITFVNSSGDSGAAECDFFQTVTSTNLATEGIAVSYPASSPEVTGVGGTGITLAALDNSTYWGTSNNTNGGSALSYIPEQVWNDDLEIYQFCQGQSSSAFCTQGGSTAQPGWVPITSETTSQNDIGISSSGGGASNCATQNAGKTACVAGFAKPSWQSVTVSGQTTRMSPDVSFLATPNFPGYVFCTPLSELTGANSTNSSCASGIQSAVDTYLSIIGGTSASAPVFAGVMTVMNQYLNGASSPGLGNVNPTLYQLALTPSNGVFHPVTSGDNFVACSVGTPTNQPVSYRCPSGGVLGFSASTSDATTGYNLVAGLGSIDVNKLATSWAAGRTATTSTVTPSSSTIFQGQSVTLTATVTHNPTGSVTFKNGTTVLGTSQLTSGTATLTTTTLPVGANSITASFNGNGTYNSSTSTATTVTVSPAFSMTADAASFQVAQGSSIDATVNVVFASGFTGTVTFSCPSFSVPGSICTPPPSINASGDVSFHITSTLPTAKMQSPFDRGSRIFYAALLPGLLGILFTVGSRKRSSNAMRVLGLVLVLGASTLWTASCGGSSNSGTTGTTGTPKGTYPITVTGTSGSITSSATFQLVVQ